MFNISLLVWFVFNSHSIVAKDKIVSSNYDICFKKYGYSPWFNRRINPYRLGFANPFVKTHFNYPYEVIGITEAQKYLFPSAYL